MSVAAKINAVIEEFFNQAAQVVQEKTQQKTQQKAVETGGAVSNTLLQDYTNVMSTIDRYSVAIQAKRQPNANTVLAYLGKIKKYVAGELSKFKAVPANNREVAVQPYQERLNKAKTLLDGLKGKQGLQ